MVDLITEHIATWTAAEIPKKNGGRGRGRGANGQSPHGIKKLRELILELAVRGKLVPQDPTDEPASVLLEKIAKERTLLVKEKKIKKPRTLPRITNEEKPFDLPNGWQFARLNDLGEWGAGATPTRGRHDYYGGDIPWFKSGELIGDYISSSEEHVTELALKKTSLRYNKPGDVLIAMYGATIGKTSILEVPATTNQAVCACTPFSGLANIFLLTLLKAYKSRFVGMGAGGAQPNISREKIIATVIAFPPLAEQHRIVVKVDELMALCDKLEQQQTDSNETHQTLVEALLATLTTSADPVEFALSWQRIEAHFDTLFTSEESIDQLKQTILQLAVMGKLVPQDPNDEPASTLLEKIAKEKAKLIKEGKIKKQNPLPKISEDEKPFELPLGWEWGNLSDLLALVTDGDHQAPPKSDSGVPFLVIGNLNTGRISFDDCRYVPQDYYQNLDWGRQPVEGDLLYTVTGSFGISIQVDTTENFCVQRHVAIFKSTKSTPRKYLSLVLGSKYAFEYATEISTGIAQKTVPLTGLRKMPIAVAPENEQHRIVAKVDELMALCDTLKERLHDAQTTQVQLADAIVEQSVA